MIALSYYMAIDCIEVRKQINHNLQHLYILGTLMMWHQSKAYLTGWTRKLWNIFAVIEFIWNILQFTQYLISSISDFLRRKWKWHTTSNIQQIIIVLRHFRKCFSKSSDHSVVSCAQTDNSTWRYPSFHEGNSFHENCS
jgi:hypothetical protein